MQIGKHYKHTRMQDCMVRILDIESKPMDNAIKVAVIWMTKSGSIFLEVDQFDIKIEELPNWIEVDWIS